MNIVLASASPRRKELLCVITPSFKIAAAEIDESKIKAANPVLLVEKLARVKCLEIAKEYNTDIVIGCDTVVEIDGDVLGKPKDERDAALMLSRLSGTRHLVHTGVCIAKNGAEVTFHETTQVYFAKIDEADLAQYVKTSEPYDKAGGYGIQSWAAKYIYKIDGCFFNVMGLPVARLNKELCEFTAQNQ